MQGALFLNIGTHTESRWQTPSARLAKGSGSTTIIGLNAIKREAGNRWDKMHEAICTRLEAMFRQRLGPSDFFVPVDDASYLVVMPASSPEEGQICCLRISYELHSSLLGSCGVEHLEIARADSVGDDVLELRPLSRYEVVQLAGKAELTLATPGTGSLGAEIRDIRPAAHAPEAPQSVELKFLPVWDAQFEVIRAYRCIHNRAPVGASVLSLQEEARELSQVTVATLTRVSEVLQAHLAKNERFVVNLPVSYAALSAPLARMEFISACRQLPCELRPYLMFKLEGLPVGVPHSRLIELVTTIGPFCRGVIARAPRHEHALDIYRGIGLKALGLGLESASFKQASAAIDRLCSVSKRAAVCAFVDDVPDVATLLYALNAGVKWVSGAAIVPPLADPGPLVRLTLNSLVEQAA